MKVTVSCTYCGVSFQKRADHLRERNYCSQDCLRNYRYGVDRHVIIICSICGKHIIRTLNRGTKYCSKSCASNAMRTDNAKWRDPEYIRAYQKRYQRTWYQKNKESILKLARLRHRRNPIRRQMHLIIRRTRERNLPNTFTHDDWKSCLEYWNYCCAICDRPRGLFHTIAADHWIPVSDPNCPGTVISNILPLCHGLGGCNNSKSNSDPIKWLINRLGKRRANARLKLIQRYFKLWIIER